MSQPVPCPGCYSMNKPDASRCRVCGRKLRESTRTRKKPQAVVLERVMSGEIFTAIIGGPTRKAAGPVKDLARERAALDREAKELEQHRRALAEYERRLQDLAEAAGHPLDLALPSRPRRRRKGRAADAAKDSVRQAIEAFKAKRYSDAVSDLEEASTDGAEDPRVWTLLGESLLRLSKPYDAAANFHRLLQLQPKSDRGWLGLAKALRQVEEYGAALEGVERALAINPALAEGWFERGVILEALEKLSEALQSFARVVELRPDHEAAKAKRTEIEQRLLERAPSGRPKEPVEGRVATPGESAGTAVVAIETAAPTPAPAHAEPDLDEIFGLKGLTVPPPSEAPAREAPKEAPAATLFPRAVEPVPRPARVRTHVDGLDELSEGGIPWGHVVLLQGTPGTMKSSLAFWVLLQNAIQDGRHGLYVSLEESADSLLRQMTSMGFPLNVTKGSLVFLDPKTAKGLLGERPDWIPALESALAAVKAERGLDLVVIDSLEALEVLAKFKDRRREIYRLFEWLRDLDVTSVVITERPDWVIGGHVLQGRWDEDFLADGVMQVRLHLVSDLEVQRRIRIVKMRGTKHEAGYLALVLDDSRFKVTRAMSP